MPYQIPIFPLPGLVLFPRTHLPLHIFEPRYRQMMEDLLPGNKRFAIANLRDGYENDYFGAPPLHRVMTTARILLADKLDDGRWNILVEGVERVELLDEIQQEPYRIARVEPLREEIQEDQRQQAFDLMRSVATTAEHIAEGADERKRLLTNLENTHKHPAIVCDIISALLVTDSYARQSLLSERDIVRRLKLLNVQLNHVMMLIRENDGLPLDNPSSD